MPISMAEKYRIIEGAFNEAAVCFCLYLVLPQSRDTLCLSLLVVHICCLISVHA